MNASPAGLQFFRPATQVRALAGLGESAQGDANAAAATGQAWSWIGGIAQAVGSVITGFSPEATKQAQANAQAQAAYAQAQMQLAQMESNRTQTLVMGGLAALLIGGGLIYVLKR